MTPEERARLTLDSKASECASCVGYHNSSFLDPPSYHETDPALPCERCDEVHFEHAYVDAIRAAIAEEREALCAALCSACAEGLPIVSHIPDDRWSGHPGYGTCRAWELRAAIRARAT